MVVVVFGMKVEHVESSLYSLASGSRFSRKSPATASSNCLEVIAVCELSFEDGRMELGCRCMEFRL